MSEQSEVNVNVQERLRTIEANGQVLAALLVAAIETHPEPDKLRQQFNYHYETLNGGWLNSALPEDWLDAAAELHKVLDGAFDRPRP